MVPQKEEISPLRTCVKSTVRQYLKDMEYTPTSDLLQIMLAEVEPAMIEEVLLQTNGNQSQTARILGITRNTLRTKILRYKINLTKLS